MIAERVSRLPEIYQPVFGHPELSTDVSRGCADRLTHIANIYRTLETQLRRPLRVLDLGCAQGFFSLSLASMGATVLGVDYLEANIAVCRALAEEQSGLAARFETGRIEAVLARLAPDQYDLVLGLSVFHHLVHESGVAAVQQMLGGLATQVAAGVFELALASEPLYWGPSQAEMPRHLLADFAFMHTLAWHPTHLSEISRPLYVASNRYWFLSGQAGAFERWASDSYRLAPGAHQGSRRYFFGEQHFVKLLQLDHPTRGTLNTQEYRHESGFLQAPPPGFAAPSLLLHGKNADEAWLVREQLPGELLIDRIAEGRAYDARRVLLDVLTQLAALEAAGLFHNDVRTWNVLIGPAGDAHLIDYGAIGKTPADCMWPHDLFLAFFIFVEEVTHARMGGADLLRTAAISPYRLAAPYRQWGLAFWATPTDQWSFKLMVQLFVQMEALPEAPSLTEHLPLPRWMGAIEESADVLTWFVRSLQEQQLRLEQRGEAREKQLLATQSQLADQLHAQWESAQASIGELRQLSHQWWALAEQRNRELHEVYTSQSWRITRPLRQAAQLLLPTLALARRAPGAARHRLEQVARSLLTHALRPLLGNAPLKSFVLRVLSRYPRTRYRLAEWVQRFGSPPDGNTISHNTAADGAPPHAELPKKLSPRAARVYVDLKQAIEARKT